MEIDNEQIKLTQVTNEKDIGVIFDQGLEFNEHIKEKVGKANKMAGIIRRAYRFLTPDVFVPLYKALCRSHFDYATSVWAPDSVRQIEQIEGVQRRATKYLPGMRDMCYEQRLRKLGLTTLTHRRYRADIIEIYKISHEIYEKEISIDLEYHTDNNIRALRGHRYKLRKDRWTSKKRRRSFTQRTVNIWNGLPRSVVEAESLNAFKSRLDSHWRGQRVLYEYREAIVP